MKNIAIFLLMLLSTTAMSSEWDQNQRFAIDLSSRVLHDFETDQTATIQFIGIDYLKIFSNSGGDYGTLLLQPYITRIDNLKKRPAFFDDEDDTELVFRNFYYNYTGLGRGRFNIRLGHFELPYGLEQIVATNGTIHNFIHGPNLGIKADWGISLNGILPFLEYDFALTRGSGNNWETKGDPYVLSGRLGTTREKNLILGISAMDGEIFTDKEQTLSRSRYGVDFTWYVRAFTLMGELSTGKDESTNVFNSLLELDWQSPYETSLLYLQFKRFSRENPQGWDDKNNLAIGARYEPDNHWQLDAQLSGDLSTMGSAAKHQVLGLQVRYRF